MINITLKITGHIPAYLNTKQWKEHIVVYAS